MPTNAHIRPELTPSEQEQNEKYIIKLRSILAERGLTLSENAKQILLRKAKISGVWLPGLSPIVFNELISGLTLSLSQGLPDEARMEIIFKHLNSKLDEENIFTREKLAKNSRQKGIEEDDQKHLIDHLQNNSLPSDYWLKGPDVIALTQVVNTIPGFHVVMPVDSYDEKAHRINNDNKIAHETARQLIGQGAEVVYVPVENNEHWILTIYTQKGEEKFNPRGDGKCGDRLVAKILCDAGERSNQNLYPKEITEKSSAAQVRQASINLISAIHGLTPNQNLPGNAPRVSNSSRPAWQSRSGSTQSASRLPTKTNPLSGNQFISEFEHLTYELNQRANRLIGELCALSPKEQKERWEQFDRTEWKSVEKVAHSKPISQLNWANLFVSSAAKNSLPTHPHSASAKTKTSQNEVSEVILSPNR